ncbi:putative Tartrateresistant acid phosphatase type 5 [Trypanosoma rangeli]|uniref:Putative Tartrateresistant acid phosphatase type 5 n=1 Tax=Trypanosoma rangeli TaxID=5698 RepID=A0A422NG88_TRYRA|nr:putative Tartrateresistant acid phosphatase type 5 [Trypanosoma rangeli]RNF04483.1 putative Tartrateresistant acid phosphatase type 5 [Trypanosoma rangeli]|eukprot:RNF04483.1 putative Tartrateresistant acid phosphatase type 5 [Trypanosoma rangeli]
MLFYLTLLILCVGCGLGNVAQGLTFGVIGDWGLGAYANGHCPEIISTRRYTELCGRLGCNFTISVGDNFYCSDVAFCIRHSFEEAMKDVPGPFFPCTGNHDNVNAQIQYSKRNPRWYWPSRYYTVKLPIDDTGHTVQLFALDSLDYSLWKGRQHDWLVEELKRSNARWKIIFGHYPTTGSGRHKRVGSVGGINQLMSQFNVQAYFSGHDHIVEVNNIEGRVLALSGGMSRGALMAYATGGKARKFTLTSPSEYSPYKQAWPSHGFITVDLAPNTMNLNVWDSAGGMHYEFVVTHDWMQKVMELPPAARHTWPPPDVVLQAMKDEHALPRGPGGGTVFFANGTRVTLPGDNDGRGGRDSTGTPSGYSAAPPTPVLKLPPTPVPDYIQYAVFTECEMCNKKFRAGKRFTLRINGETLSLNHRLYLTDRSDGCDDAHRGNHVLPGTRIETPLFNTLLLNVTRVVERVYVCLSVDAGATYSRLLREDTVEELYTFSITAL